MGAAVRINDIADLPDIEGERHVFELLHHLAATEAAQGAIALRAPTVLQQQQ